MALRQFRYVVTAGTITDGDTMVLVLDLGFDITRRVPVRFAGVNAPESHGPEREAGLLVAQVAQKWLDKWLPAGVVLVSKELDKYGRVLGVLERDGGTFAGDLLAAKVVNPYDGGKRDPLTSAQITAFVAAAKAALALP